MPMKKRSIHCVCEYFEEVCNAVIDPEMIFRDGLYILRIESFGTTQTLDLIDGHISDSIYSDSGR